MKHIDVIEKKRMLLTRMSAASRQISSDWLITTWQTICRYFELCYLQINPYDKRYCPTDPRHGSARSGRRCQYRMPCCCEKRAMCGLNKRSTDDRRSELKSSALMSAIGTLQGFMFFPP